MKNVIDFNVGSTKAKSTRDSKVVTVEVFKVNNKGDYTYRTTKGKHFNEELAGYCMSNFLRDIIIYTASPEDILEAIETVMERFGFDGGDVEDGDDL